MTSHVPFTWHPNNIMTYLCLCSVPVHGQVGGTVNWLSMFSGVVLSGGWMMTVGFDSQLGDQRRSSQLSMVVASAQMFLIQSNILHMKRLLSNQAHMTVLGAYFTYHAARFYTVSQRREIAIDDTRANQERAAAAAAAQIAKKD